MPLSAETLQSLTTLMRDDPDLMARLRGATDEAQAARLLVEAAASQGLTVSAAAVAQLIRTSAGTRLLNDDELDGTSGGNNPTRNPRSPFDDLN